MVPDIKIFCKAIAIKTGWCWWKDGQNRETRNEPTQAWPIDFLKRCKGSSVEKGKSFQQMVLKHQVAYKKQWPLTYTFHFTQKWTKSQS